MRIDGSVPGSTCQVLSIAIGNVLPCLRVSEPLSKTEIDNVNIVLLLSDADQEVVWLNVSVKEVA